MTDPQPARPLFCARLNFDAAPDPIYSMAALLARWIEATRVWTPDTGLRLEALRRETIQLLERVE